MYACVCIILRVSGFCIEQLRWMSQENCIRSTTAKPAYLDLTKIKKKIKIVLCVRLLFLFDRFSWSVSCVQVTNAHCSAHIAFPEEGWLPCLGRGDPWKEGRHGCRDLKPDSGNTEQPTHLGFGENHKKSPKI